MIRSEVSRSTIGSAPRATVLSRCSLILMTNIQRFEAFERSIGRVIRAHRERRGWTQRDLAARMIEDGFSVMTQSTVAKVEVGTRPLRLAEFVGFAHALGMPWQAMLAQQEPLLDERNPLADLENRVAAAQMLEEDALEQLREGIESMTAFYAERRAERTALAREYAELGARPIVDEGTQLGGPARQPLRKVTIVGTGEGPGADLDAAGSDAASAAVER